MASVPLTAAEVAALWKLVIATGLLRPLTYMTEAEVRLAIGDDAAAAVPALERLRAAYVQRDIDPDGGGTEPSTYVVIEAGDG